MQTRRNPGAGPQLATVMVWAVMTFYVYALNSLASFIVKGTEQFRVPFKVPFITASVDRQVTPDKAEPICDEAAPLPDPDDPSQKVSIDLTDQDDGALSCELCCPTKGRHVTMLVQTLSLLASPFSLPDDDIDLDVSFSQKIPVGRESYDL